MSLGPGTSQKSVGAPGRSLEPLARSRSESRRFHENSREPPPARREVARPAGLEPATLGLEG